MKNLSAVAPHQVPAMEYEEQEHVEIVHEKSHPGEHPHAKIVKAEAHDLFLEIVVKENGGDGVGISDQWRKQQCHEAQKHNSQSRKYPERLFALGLVEVEKKKGNRKYVLDVGHEPQSQKNAYPKEAAATLFEEVFEGKKQEAEE